MQSGSQGKQNPAARPTGLRWCAVALAFGVMGPNSSRGPKYSKYGNSSYMKMSESNFAKIQVFWNSKLRCCIVKRRKRSQICKLNLWMATTAVASFCQTRKFAKVFFFFFFCFLELR